jgi:hypothetical protein
MDEDLKLHLDGMEGRIADRIDGIADRIDSRMDLFEERVKSHITQSLDDLATRVISEFHKWDYTSEVRPPQAITDTRRTS